MRDVKRSGNTFGVRMVTCAWMSAVETEMMGVIINSKGRSDNFQSEVEKFAKYWVIAPGSATYADAFNA